jgi:hypothetical protein
MAKTGAPIRYLYRSHPALKIPAPLSGNKGRTLCPYCWHAFPPSETLFIARHQDLLGDPVLGPEAYRRFLPQRFTPEGNALDAGGLACPDRACPRCHLRIPNCFWEAAPFFVSIVGAPGCGKSYFLTSMSWALRRNLPASFALFFGDADARTNQWLADYESALFVNPRRDEPVSLRKTEMQGDLYERIVLRGMTLHLPRPAVFSLRPQEGHPAFEKGAHTAGRVVVVYDNAGEHFQPGMDSAANPGTQHLAQSQAVLFLFDPTADPRFLQTCARGGAALAPARVALRQETLLTEMINRMTSYRGLRAGRRIDIPLIVVGTKADVWRHLLPDGAGAPPWRRSATLGTSAIEMDALASVSLSVRHWFAKACPEMVTAAEAAFRHVFYIPASALGHNPPPDSRGAVAVLPREIRPWWVEVPLLYVLALAGLAPVVERADDGRLPPSPAEFKGDRVRVRMPDGRWQTIPSTYAGRTLRCPQTGAAFRIPPPPVEPAAVDR